MEDENFIIKGPKYKFPPLDENCGMFFLRCMKNYSTKVVRIDPSTNENDSFDDLHKKCIQTAKSLKRIDNIIYGDMIMMMTDNRFEDTYLLIASYLVGATIFPIHCIVSNDDIVRFINLTQPKLFFCNKNNKLRIESLIEKIDFKLKLIVIEENFSNYLESDGDITFECEKRSDWADTIGMLLTSSGTMGPQKAVTISHNAIYCSSYTLSDLIEKNDIVCHFSTVSWMSGIIFNFGSLIKGVPFINVNYEPDFFFSTLEKYKVTWTFISPLPMQPLIKDKTFFKKYDLTSIKFFMTGGAPSIKEELIQYRKIFPNAFVHNAYGNTEMMSCLGGFDRNKDKEENDRKICSHGRLFPGLEAKVIDIVTKEPLEKNQVGELCLRSPSLTKGYYTRDENFNVIIKPVISKENPWFHIGDIAYFDEDDCFYHKARLNDAFYHKGKLIVANDIEKILLLHPNVQSAAVIEKKTFAIENNNKVQIGQPFAFVVEKEKNQTKEIDLINFVNGQVEEHLHLTGGLEFIDSMPTTPSGKIKRIELHARLQ